MKIQILLLEIKTIFKFMKKTQLLNKNKIKYIQNQNKLQKKLKNMNKNMKNNNTYKIIIMIIINNSILIKITKKIILKKIRNFKKNIILIINLKNKYNNT